MSYTREQRAANAAKKAGQAAQAVEGGESAQAVESTGDPQPQAKEAFDIGKRDITKSVRGRSMSEIEERQIKTDGITRPEPEPEATPAAVDKAPEPPAEPAATPEPVKTVKVKVDGEEFEAPQADIDAAGGIHPYQTQRATENRLKKANETLAHIQRLYAEAAQRVPATPAQPVVTDDAFIASKMDVIRFGTAEESAAAMREVSSRLNPKVNTNEIIIQANTNMRHDNALAKFKTDFQDIAANPLLGRLVPQLAQEGLAAYVKNGSPDWGQLGALDFDAFYAKIGNQIRGAVPRPSQPQPAAAATTGTPSPATPDREARKASIVNLPTAAARAALPAEENPGTPEEQRNAALADMRKARKVTQN